MITWSDIPTAGKMTASAVGVLAAAVTWMFVTFETASGSDQKWAEHNQAITCRTVYEMKAQIRDYMGQLRSGRLSQQDIDWIKAEIDNLQEDIKRLDPNGVC